MRRENHCRWHSRVWGVLLSSVLLPALTASGDFDPRNTVSWAVPSADLYDVDAHGERGWAVGYWGTVVRSTDGGRTWFQRPTPTDETLYAVSFADETHGWAVGAGGSLLRSTDGGLGWERIEVAVKDEFEGERPLDSALFDVSAVSAHEAWAVGDFGIVLHTRDGTQWQQVRIPEEALADDNIPDRIFNAVEFTDSRNGWIAGEFGTTLRTTDGGESWVGERSLRGAVEDVYLIDIAAGADGGALAAGVGGVVIETSDGGASWRALEVPTSAGLFGAARHAARALVVGDRGVVFASRDAGHSWFEPVRPRLFNWFRAATYVGEARAFIVGENGVILRSDDAGESWTLASGEEPPSLERPAGPDPPRSTLPGRENDERNGN